MNETGIVAPANMTVGALQGPNTFGGEAAARFLLLYPELFSKIVFYETSEIALSFEDGRADAIVPPQQMSRTGFHARTQGRIAAVDSKLYVLAEVIHAYHCSLLVKPGSRLEDIAKVLGHTGSITQSRHWLEKHVPQADIIVVGTSSMDAAKAVAEGDKTVASIGTSAMAEEFGLQELCKDVDGGSVGSYWAVSPKAIFSAEPTRVVVAGRFGDGGALTDLVCALAGAGFQLETIFNSASGQRLYEYDYAMRFGGRGSLTSIESAVARVPGARLAGAFVAKE